MYISLIWFLIQRVFHKKVYLALLMMLKWYETNWKIIRLKIKFKLVRFFRIEKQINLVTIFQFKLNVVSFLLCSRGLNGSHSWYLPPPVSTYTWDTLKPFELKINKSIAFIWFSDIQHSFDRLAASSLLWQTSIMDQKTKGSIPAARLTDDPKKAVDSLHELNAKGGRGFTMAQNARGLYPPVNCYTVID